MRANIRVSYEINANEGPMPTRSTILDQVYPVQVRYSVLRVLPKRHVFSIYFIPQDATEHQLDSRLS
jgi:hypothetical protein